MAVPLATMDDEFLKSKTDCVYFLASPLTCKKGSECEFRHSESTRLNPTDCWYWLNGSCLNPNCAFRHPPLEGLSEPLPNTVQSLPYTAVETSKSNVPCYFYFNAYCIKGDQCPFLHESPQKFLKAASEPAPTNPVEIKHSSGSDTGPASVEVPPNPSESTSQLVKQSHSKEVQEPARGGVSEESSPSAQSSVPECEEPGIKLPDSPLPPDPSQDQSLEEPEKECVEQDEWWESSPGFDVLVDDGSEQLAYQDDAEYLLAQERESEMLGSHLVQYDFEGPAGYDPLDYYPNAGYDSYDHLESRHRHTPDYFERDSEQPRGGFLEPIIDWKRKLDVDDRDLRHHLRKRRRMDVRQVSHSSRRHRSRTRGNSREQPVRRGSLGPALHGRLASEVGKNMIGPSRSERESFWNDRHRQSWSGYPERHPRSRHRERESMRHARAPPVLSEFSQSSASMEATSGQVTAVDFTAPKTRRPMSEDFEGPKPLIELLKDKRKHGASMSGGTDCPVSLHIPSQAEKRVTHKRYDSDSDDDDGLGKKFGRFLSR